MKLLRRPKKTNVRRSTRSRNRVHQTLDLGLGIDAGDIPPFGNRWDLSTTQVEETLELRRSA